MQVFKKALILLFGFILSSYVIWPIQHSYAFTYTSAPYGSTVYYNENNGTLKGWIDCFFAPTHIIAGSMFDTNYRYDDYAYWKTGNNIKEKRLYYSTDNEVTWTSLPRIKNSTGTGYMLPIDPQLTKAVFRCELIGTKFNTAHRIPYPIYQPTYPTDLAAIPNDDGTVTLNWNDTSNMESYYRITRFGPDGTKTFTVNKTMDHIGPLSYADKETNKTKSTIYVYKLNAVVDFFDLPEDLRPWDVWATVKTKAAAGVLDKYKIDTPIVNPNAINPNLITKIDPNTPLKNLDDFKYLGDFSLKIADLDKVALSGVTLDKKAVVLKQGESDTLKATVFPSDPADQKVTWSSDNSKVADVDSSGKVTAKSPGTARITAKTESGGSNAVCVVTVTGIPEINSQALNQIVIPDLTDVSEHKPIGEIAKITPNNIIPDNISAGSGIMLNQSAMIVKTGESGTLTATVSPSEAANQKVAWSSSDSTVAAVDSTGKVTGIAPGTAKITVKTEDGRLTAVCDVTVTVVPESKPQAPNPFVTPKFTDISEHKSAGEIAQAVTSGFVNGYPDGTFRPDAGVTRAEFATMLMKGLNPAVEGAPLSFADKDEIGAWAVQPVAQAVQLGIISGYADYTFRPNENITRAEMIAMVMRASGLATDNAQQTGFADDAAIPMWAKPSVSKAEETGIIIVGGLPDHKFSPQALSTRAEAASAIVRMLGISK
ncbi:S-layer homology domain-containing protein [Paenibacillus piri]|uniref:SLH domain-containing protein n=1 Tax=Paenibacillus piri TaxID=2547395 RepID=A0A4R5KFN1_9BACL|nr:S-layer homology domain-containing protein [Paenibacillus piri]TDF93782.1 hypothetical protein E1757_25665 [Paenibacillus piri]